MADYGIKVSEPGYDVLTAADKNLSLKSGMTLLKVFDEDSVSVASPDTTISHDLGYEPQFLAWIYNDDGGIKDEGVGLVTGSDTFGTGYINDSDLYLTNSIASLDARYYIFYEPLTTGTSPSITETSSYGIKVSKDGSDVKTANILNQTFNSEKNCLKIGTEGTDTQTVNTSYNFIVSHGLSVTPGYLVFFEVDNGGDWFSDNMKDTTSGKNVVVNAWTTSTQFIARAESDSSCTVKIKYYIFVDQAT